MFSIYIYRLAFKNAFSTYRCPLCAKSGLRDRYGMSDVNRTNETNVNNEELEIVPPADQTCVTIRGRFLAINSATMTCRCDKAKKGISPAAHLGNGCSDLIIVSQCSRINYLRYLVRTGLLSASPVRAKSFCNRQFALFLFC